MKKALVVNTNLRYNAKVVLRPVRVSKFRNDLEIFVQFRKETCTFTLTKELVKELFENIHSHNDQFKLYNDCVNVIYENKSPDDLHVITVKNKHIKDQVVILRPTNYKLIMGYIKQYIKLNMTNGEAIA